MNVSFIKTIIEHLSAAIGPVLKEELKYELSKQSDDIRKIVREEIDKKIKVEKK